MSVFEVGKKGENFLAGLMKCFFAETRKRSDFAPAVVPLEDESFSGKPVLIETGYHMSAAVQKRRV